MREAETWCTAAQVAGVMEYPYEQLAKAWKTVLLHQFHDILPGSSIHWVHREAEAVYAELAVELDALIAKAQQALAGEGDRQITFNASPHARDGVAAMGAGESARRRRGVGHDPGSRRLHDRQRPGHGQRSTRRD